MSYKFRFVDDSCIGESLTTVGCFSFVMTFRDRTYVVICGNFSGGWFVAVPNWNAATSIWMPSEDNIPYNTEQILDVLDIEFCDAAAIAEAICKHKVLYFT